MTEWLQENMIRKEYALPRYTALDNCWNSGIVSLSSLVKDTDSFSKFLDEFVVLLVRCASKFNGNENINASVLKLALWSAAALAMLDVPQVRDWV